MKVRSKSLTYDVFRFDGSLVSAVEAKEWVSGHDVEDCEVSYQGLTPPLALDVILRGEIKTIEAGGVLLIREGKLTAETGASFGERYEQILD